MFRKIVVLIFISLTCAWFALEADDSDATLERPTQPVYQREFPDDAPGIPARRVTGVLPSSPIRFGIATTFQVNVNSLGADILGDAANEPSIAVDPNEPNVMAIVWRQFDTITSNFRQAGWGHTTDGGRTWTFPGVIEPGVFRSDPVLTSDAEGIFYYNSLKVVGGVYSCQVFKSGDGGQTWPTGAEAFGGDKQWFTIDHGNSVGHGNIYQAWNTAAGCCGDTTFNRSTDGGSSFSHPIRIPATPIFGTLDVDSDGDMYVLGIDPNNWSTFLVAKSTNAKYAQYIPSFDMVTPMYLGGAMRFGGGGGSPNPGGLLGQGWIAVDRSGGPTHGNVYVLCSVDPPNVDPLDIYFARSTDGGQTWSAPIRVNDDAVVSWGWQWFGTMSVAPNGRIDVIWNDNRNTVSASLAELFYSYSTDGGVTWSANQQLSPEFNSHIGWPNQNKIGDYYDMVSDDVGASLAWSATFTGGQDVYYTRIGDWDCNTNGVPDSVDIATKQSADNNDNGIPDECEGLQTAVQDQVASSWQLLQNFPNPFNPITVIRYVVPEGGGRVTLRVFDVKGRLVQTLTDRFESAGERTATWDGLDHRGMPAASGLYFYRLEAPNYEQTRKMLLLR